MQNIIMFVAALVLVGCGGDKAEMADTPANMGTATSPTVVAAAGGNPAAELAAQEITDDYMRSIVVEISDDRYEGRGPGSQGDVMARAYLAEGSG